MPIKSKVSTPIPACRGKCTRSDGGRGGLGLESRGGTYSSTSIHAFSLLSSVSLVTQHPRIMHIILTFTHSVAKPDIPFSIADPLGFKV